MSDSAKSRQRVAVTDATREKISDHVARSWANPEVKAKRALGISEALKKRYADMTDEQKRLFSEARKKAWEVRRLNKLI